MQILIWALSVVGLAAMYWGFRVNREFWARMATLGFIGAVYLWGIWQGMDSVWFNGTGIAILIVAFWPAPKKPDEAAPPSDTGDGDTAKPD